LAALVVLVFLLASVALQLFMQVVVAALLPQAALVVQAVTVVVGKAKSKELNLQPTELRIRAAVAVAVLDRLAVLADLVLLLFATQIALSLLQLQRDLPHTQ
jgi:hypothetical protein